MLQSFTCVLLCFACLCLVIVHRGVMIRGLMSVYAQSVATTLLVVLKALNNSQHIHVANSSDFHASLEARERVNQEKLRLKTICTEDRTRRSYLSYFYSVRNCLCVCVRGSAERETADREEQWLQEPDENEFDALPEEEKECIIQQRETQTEEETQLLTARRADMKFSPSVFSYQFSCEGFQVRLIKLL